LRDGDRVCRPGIDFVLPERECSPCEALDAAFARSNNAVFVQARGEQLRHLRASLRKRARSSISKHVSVLRNPTETEMRGNIMLLRPNGPHRALFSIAPDQRQLLKA
jgi:hypothetical protein